jgi:hypothetical protein
MSYAAGVGWALLAAIAHSAIDVLRKLGSQRMAPAGKLAQTSTVRCCNSLRVQRLPRFMSALSCK